MKFKDFEVHASPFFSRVYCPKHGNEMIELENGWFSICWYCFKCKYPYEIRLKKMLNVNEENLAKILKEKKLNSKEG